MQAATFERLVKGQIHETVGPAPGRRPGRALPERAGRQDRLADRDRGPVRRPLRRRRARRHRSAAPLRRAHRGGVPALRRHPRHRVGLDRVGQDAGHRPARGRRHAARAVRAARRSEPGQARLRELVAAPITDDADARRGAGACCGSRPRSPLPARPSPSMPRPRAACSPRCPTSPLARPSRRSPTACSSAPADPRVRPTAVSSGAPAGSRSRRCARRPSTISTTSATQTRPKPAQRLGDICSWSIATATSRTAGPG